MKGVSRADARKSSGLSGWRDLRFSAAAIVGCALLMVLPLMLRGNSCGHDFDFHLQSWLEVSHQWHEGVIYPRWVTSANYGAGEPRLVFYPPVTWLVGGALGTLLPWSAVPVVFILLALVSSGFSLYALARESLDPEAARIAAILYVVNPYLLFVVYERSAFGELAAAAILPLVFLFSLRNTLSLVPLAFTIAAMWLTNAPAAVMACYSVAVLVTCRAILERDYRPILRAAAGVALGIGVSAFYIVPALLQQPWVEIGRAINPGMRVEDSFLFGHTGEAFHDQVLHSASWIAVVLIFVAAAAASWIRVRRVHGSITRPLVILLAILVLLQLPMSDLVWRHAPELRFLQFPWRWLLVIGLIAALLVGIAWKDRVLGPQRGRWRAAAALAIAATLVWFGSTHYRQFCDDEDAVSAQVATFRSAAGFEGTDEYTPRGADNSILQQGLPQVRVVAQVNDDAADSGEQNPQWKEPTIRSAARIEVAEWSSEHKVLRIQGAPNGFAVLRLMDYPAWQVRLNGQPVQARPTRNDGLMTIPITAGTSTIEVRYGTTRDLWIGLVLSITALLALLGLGAKGKKWQKHRIS